MLKWLADYNFYVISCDTKWVIYHRFSMSEQQNKPMSREEREKLLEDVRQKGVLDPLERETLAQKLDADFDAFLSEQLKSSNSNDTQDTPATERDIENLAEASVLFFRILQL